VAHQVMRGRGQVIRRAAVEGGDEALLGGHGLHGQKMRRLGCSSGLIFAAVGRITLG
jgi:hypothetical protein